ncbi:MAG: PLDc_N domain-containing protein [Austwickia sp.]|jgi:hypothetical protein|nr:MAG: PLDc_N domain-containing protein [Austwickia sp.]
MSWDALDPTGRALIGLLVAAQLTLMIVALVRWHRTPDERLALLPRWGWLLVIVFGQLVGPLVFLAVGRAAEPVPEAARRGDQPPAPDAVARAVESLYGERPPASS